ncbi:MAG: VWA domain-containing protein [Gaiellaceae bacterium]
MSFEAPLYLLGLLAVPLAIAAYVLLHRARGRVEERFSSRELMPNVVDRAPGRLRHLPAAVMLLGAIALLVGVARPHASISVRQEQATVVLAIDTSRSMAATDVEPSRLEAAKAAARMFLERVPKRFRVGVVAFASTARAVSPATANRSVTHAALQALRPGEGTALGEAIVRSLEVAKVSARRGGPPVSVLVISDGAQMGGRVNATVAARRAQRLRVPVHTILVGTEQGIVEVKHVGGFIERIQVPPSPDTLRAVARTTRGRFFEAPDGEELAAVYEELGSRLGRTKKRTEITFAFGAGGTLLMLAGGLLSAVLFRRLP